MNPACQKCGAVCCRTLFIRCGVEAHRFLETRGVATADGVLIDSRCRHLDRTNRCSIYATRPPECVVYEPDGPACRMTRTLKQRNTKNAKNARREFPAASAGKLDGVVGSLDSET